MKNLLIFVSILFLFNASAQESALYYEKQDSIFFYPQLNLSGGYDNAEPGDHWGAADKGAKNKLSLEWFVKDRERMQLGYTKFIRPVAWNFKFDLEWDPEEGDEDDGEVRWRPQDIWIKFGTKWDRTSFTIGHKSYVYGHNPKLDSGHSFMPNQSSVDLGFSKDTGIFFKTPFSEDLDWESSLTLGMGDTLDYHGGWLFANRIGSPTFKPNEFGVFTLIGDTPKSSGTYTVDQEKTEVSRIGADWVYKHRESYKIVNQVSFGYNRWSDNDREEVYNILNSAEFFLSPKWTVGATNALRYHDRVGSQDNDRGTIFTTISYAITRKTRFRVNLYREYMDEAGSENNHGILFQLCFNCGLIK
jgi:hypothetical protein